MPKLYFIGGASTRKREGADIYKKAFSDAGKSPIILTFPWTRKHEDKSYRKITSDFFRELGAKKSIFAELSDSKKELIKKIKTSNIINLPGGNPRLLVNRIRDHKLIQILKEYKGVIIGNSAGALAFCKKYVAVEGQDLEPRTTLLPGLGLADIYVTVHYGSSDPIHAGKGKPEIQKLSKAEDKTIYAIPERSALIYNNGQISNIGEIYLLEEGRAILRKERNGKL